MPRTVSAWLGLFGAGCQLAAAPLAGVALWYAAAAVAEGFVTAAGVAALVKAVVFAAATAASLFLGAVLRALALLRPRRARAPDGLRA
jgi:cell division protein FtsX